MRSSISRKDYHIEHYIRALYARRAEVVHTARLAIQFQFHLDHPKHVVCRSLYGSYWVSLASIVLCVVWPSYNE
ncbi:hypothetical protein QJS10_CPA07g00348 [Acorus calamus]|uniref:Uncharacterized protein n=1 Tax=Acorus calamus TaxID=4465 RepID=A0AAV9EF14_ACOCL|nr:hypothetical protein QJS10_CPA07g00348 [Acorus calamus]